MPTLVVLPVLLAWASAAAQQPDLAVTIDSAEQVPGTAKVQFSVTVTNVGDAPSIAATSPAGAVDLMFFPDSAAPPTTSEGKPEHQWLVPDLSPGAFETYPILIDYELGGSYKAWAMVDTVYFDPETEPFAFPEKSKDNNLASKSLSIVVPGADQADLLVPKLEAKVTGEHVIYKVTVQNIGKKVAPDGFKVDVLHDAPGGACPPPQWENLPTTLYGNVFKDVEGGLGPGGTKELSFAPALPGGGCHKACAAVDLDDLVPESSEQNNFFGPVEFCVDVEPPPPDPDLEPCLFTVKNVASDVVQFDIQVCNVGSKVSGACTVELFAQSPTAPVAGEIPTKSWAMTPLAPGGSVPFQHQHLGAVSGEYNAWVWVKCPEDADASNDKAGPLPYKIVIVGDYPDLVVEVDPKTDVQVVGDDVHYDVTVLNKGKVGAKDVEIFVFFSYPELPDCLDPTLDLASVPMDTVVIPTLGPGAKVTSKLVWSGPPDGIHQAWAVVDCMHQIKESDETNNGGGPYAVEVTTALTDGPDLFVADYKVKADCTSVSFHAVVKNIGDAPANPFWVHIHFDSEQNPNFWKEGDKALYYGEDDAGGDPIPGTGLAAGGEIQVDTIWKDAPDGTYNTWLVVDQGNKVAEQMEGNNIAGPMKAVVDESACLCENNVQITKPCKCGDEMVTEGFCCVPLGEWSPEQFDPASCSDAPIPEQPGPETSALEGMPEGVLPPESGTGGSAALYDVRGSVDSIMESSCTRTPAPSPGGAAPLLLLLVLVALLATRRR